jgi:large subunit ribosomal protein L24
MNKIKTGDTVRVIAGKSKGREGKVLAVKDGRVLVEGVNMVTKHQKPSAGNPQGGIVNKEAYLDISNVMFLLKGQPTRIGFKLDGDKKVRVAKKSGEAVD